jgi:hypothetical protein
MGCPRPASAARSLRVPLALETSVSSQAYVRFLDPSSATGQINDHTDALESLAVGPE